MSNQKPTVWITNRLDIADNIYCIKLSFPEIIEYPEYEELNRKERANNLTEEERSKIEDTRNNHINIIMENGMISDTLLFYSSNVVAEMGKGLFSIVMLLIFGFLGIFIPSTSGLAVLSMPILAPLADTVGLSRAVVVDAFTWGQGVILFITPTGLIFVVLQIVGIPYNKWLKFVMPLMLIITTLIIAIMYIRSVFF